MTRYKRDFDMKGSGDYVNETAGETLGNHKLVYRGIDGYWYLADADAAATMPVLGITMGAIPAGRKGEVLLDGYIGDSAWAWVGGSEVYASTTAGELTAVAPIGIGDIVQVVAIAVDANIIQFTGNVGGGHGGSNTLEGETAFVGFDISKNHYVNYFYCNGVADDVQIQAALDYVETLGGGSVYLEQGDYEIHDQIQMPSNITLFSDSKDAVLTRRAGNTDTMLLIDTSATNVTIQGFKIDGNNAVGTNNIISGPELTSNIKIHDMILVNSTGMGIFLRGDTGVPVENVWITNCDITACTRYCVQLRYMTNGYVHNNYFSNGRAASIGNYGGLNLWDETTYIEVSDNIFYTNGEYSIFAGAASICVISGNIIDTSYYGVYNPNDGTQVLGNTISNCIRGVYIYSPSTSFSDVHIIGNQFYPSGASNRGIATGADAGESITDLFIIGNKIMGAAERGISLGRTSDSVIIDNYINGATTGIYEDSNSSDNTIKNNRLICTIPASIAGTDTQLHEIALYVKDPDSNIGTHPAMLLGDGVDVTIYDQLQIPLEFQQLITAQIIIVPGGTGNLRRSAASNWGKIASGEAYNAANDSIAAGQVAVDADDLEGIDVSSLFTGIAGGDQIGFTFTREGSNVNDTVNADCYYLGGRIRYV